MGPISHTYVSQRLRLHFLEWGSASSPPLLLLHGGRDHCRSWDYFAERFSKNWRVICPDLRGHGDSEWVSDGNYEMAAYIYDLDQLIHQQKLAPVTIVAHSLGGNIALRYSGLFPENIKSLVAIEGLGFSPKMMDEREKRGLANRLRSWISKRRDLAGRQVKKYSTVAQAIKRMQEENAHLTERMANHLTVHGINQNEDGTYSWKFDNYVRAWPAYDMASDEIKKIWGAIECPTLLVHGNESWASDPEIDGRGKFFKNVQIEGFDKAGHWVHHDCPESFYELVSGFIRDSS